MHRRTFVALSTTALLVTLMAGMLLAVPVLARSGPATGGSFALSGQAARDFKLPADMVKVRAWKDANGRTTTRYQQVVDKASVFGAQITLTRDAQGTIVAMLTKDQLIGQGEIVFVDLGKGSGVEVGNRLYVVRRGDALPPKSKDTVGQDDRRFPARALGEVVIVELGQKISVGLVTLAVQEMSVGDIVMMQKK